MRNKHTIMFTEKQIEIFQLFLEGIGADGVAERLGCSKVHAYYTFRLVLKRLGIKQNIFFRDLLQRKQRMIKRGFNWNI